jgi:ribosomal subunit interface protein
MNVEITGRQFEVTPAIRKTLDTGLTKLGKILGDNFKSKVILTAEKQRRIAEITITRRTKPIVGLAESVDMSVAIGQALKSQESVALRPMTIEEAIKECEFRDREVFVFRDKEGNVKVLHRKKDGKLELIEA